MRTAGVRGGVSDLVAETASCLYEGTLMHQRSGHVNHAFRYRTQMLYLDLDEVDDVLDRHPLWSSRHPAPGWLRRRDHLGPPHVPLAQAVRSLVAERTGEAPGGPIRLLTQARHLGLGYNPVSFFYCFGRDRLVCVVAEATNTPWGERHIYVLRLDPNGRARTAKRMHVSPFLPMAMDYNWRLPTPGARLRVDIRAQRQDGSGALFARLDLARSELTPRTLTRLALGVPPSLRVVGGIYREAWRLRRQRASHYHHPARARTDGDDI